MALSQKGLTKDSPCPPLAPGKHRLYSMRFCPFSQRVRAVLAHKGVEFEVVNIDLMSKPEWLATKNPNLEVPILERDDNRIWESLVIVDFLEDVKPEPALYPKDSLQRAHQKMLIASCATVYNGYYALMQAKGDKEKVANAMSMMKKGISFFEAKLKTLGTDFFGGSTVGMVDYMIYPWFERFPIYLSKELPFQLDIMPAKDFEKMTAWFKRMQGTPGIKGAAVSLEHHIGFIKGIILEKKFNYDYGL